MNPTQSQYPWRAVLRTVAAAIVSVAAIWGLIVEAAGVDATGPVVALTLAVAGGITRIMAIPQVEVFLKKFAPFLSAEPNTPADTGEAA